MPISFIAIASVRGWREIYAEGNRGSMRGKRAKCRICERPVIYAQMEASNQSVVLDSRPEKRCVFNAGGGVVVLDTYKLHVCIKDKP
jgi:hypothetical protein